MHPNHAVLGVIELVLNKVHGSKGAKVMGKPVRSRTGGCIVRSRRPRGGADREHWRRVSVRWENDHGLDRDLGSADKVKGVGDVVDADPRGLPHQENRLALLIDGDNWGG